MKNSVNIDEIINKAVGLAIKQYDKEKMIEQKDRRFHNTRLLMRNYNRLKDHIENVTDDVEFKIEEDTDDKVWLRSMVRTKLRTMKMLAYVDSALKIVEKEMRKSCVEYKYKAFELCYIEEKTNEEIAEILGCGKNQPKRWSDLALNELSVLLWGIEALGM